METQRGLDYYKGQLEKVMMGLNPDLSVEQHRLYLGGYIDCLFDSGMITEEMQQDLYAEYAC